MNIVHIKFSKQLYEYSVYYYIKSEKLLVKHNQTAPL